MKRQFLKEWGPFLVQAVLAGLAIAFVIVAFYPALLPQRGTNAAQAAGDAGSRRVSYHDAIRRVAPAVVNVYATQMVQKQVNPLLRDPLFRRLFGNQEPEQQVNNNLGSGVILNKQGYILTNAHVINQAMKIQITLDDGRQAQAAIVGIDSDTDLAVLKINLKNLPEAPVGDSDHLEVGDVVLAIGNPYNVGQTVTQGIVSAMGRQRLGISAIEDFIQTDADINPGNSGGALINADGSLVGINTAIYTRSGGSQGIGFAIPIKLAVGVMQQILDKGYVVRGWLGLEVRTLPRDIAEATGLDHGVLVTGVIGNSPADRAGLQPGDILTDINGHDMHSPQQTIQTIVRADPGTVLNLDVLRGWNKMQVQATVTQQPSYLR